MNNAVPGIVSRIIDEYIRAADLHPEWPSDPVHASAILNEEVGELTKAVLEWVFQDGDFAELEKEAIQVGAMAVRFLANLDKYKEWK